VTPPQDLGHRVAGARGDSIVKRGERTVSYSAIDFEPAAYFLRINPPKRRQHVTQRGKEPKQKSEENESVRKGRKARQDIKQGEGDERPEDDQDRPSAPPKALPEERQPRQTELTA
jgi:hypothetical protein